MRQVTASGQTVDEAINSALEQLQATRDQVDVNVIDEGKRGILGLFGSKLAVVNVSVQKDPVEETEQFIKEVTEGMNVSVTIKTTLDENHVTYELSGDKIALLIGKRGQTLNALQYLVQLVINKGGNHFFRVSVDAEGYRGRRKQTLETLATRMADKAIRLNRKVALEPMPAFERKIIHTQLQSRNDIETNSEGVEPHRYLTIRPLS